MTDDIRSLNIGEFTLRHDTLYRRVEVLVHGQNISQIVQPLLNLISVRKNPFHPDANQIIIPDELKDLLLRVCETAFKLKKTDEYCSAAYLVTSYFESITGFPNMFVRNCQYTLACSFWSEILSHVWKWESENNAEIHKGHPYFFLAFAYFLSGDYDTGFIYAYNGIEDDRKLGKNCPHLNYPEEAPIYWTALMIDDNRNTMRELVKDLRVELNTHITSYEDELNKTFKIQDFDTKFLRSSNPSIESLRYLFVFCFWSLTELKKKTRPFILRNDFSRIRNLNLIFNLCLLIDKLLESNTKIGHDKMSSNVINVCRINNWLSESELRDLESIYKIDINKDDPDKVLPILLTMDLKIGHKKIRKEAIHYLIAWNLRNYGGHKISQQKSLVENFDNIFQILMRCIILSVDIL